MVPRCSLKTVCLLIILNTTPVLYPNTLYSNSHQFCTPVHYTHPMQVGHCMLLMLHVYCQHVVLVSFFSLLFSRDQPSEMKRGCDLILGVQALQHRNTARQQHLRLDALRHARKQHQDSADAVLASISGVARSKDLAHTILRAQLQSLHQALHALKVSNRSHGNLVCRKCKRRRASIGPTFSWFGFSLLYFITVLCKGSLYAARCQKK